MRQLVILVSIVAALMAFAGCKKEEEKTVDCTVKLPTPVEQEMQAVADYLAVNNINDAVRSEDGFYYTIGEPGTGAKPVDNCSDILVNYKGYLVNGAIFDQNTDQKFTLGGLVKGWQAGLRLIAGGGKIKLYLPPSLGYGVNGTVSIPGNAILIFEIDLLKVY